MGWRSARKRFRFSFSHSARLTASEDDATWTLKPFKWIVLFLIQFDHQVDRVFVKSSCITLFLLSTMIFVCITNVHP